jgi:hypothetical protein
MSLHDQPHPTMRAPALNSWTVYAGAEPTRPPSEHPDCGGIGRVFKQFAWLKPLPSNRRSLIPPTSPPQGATQTPAVEHSFSHNNHYGFQFYYFTF